MVGKGARTKADILELALRRASLVGLEGLSIGTLARDAGMSKSGLFAHFGSKTGLQIAVLHMARDRFARKVVLPAIKQPRGEPRVIAMFDNWLDWTESPQIPGGCLFVNGASEFDDRPGPVRDVLAAAVGAWRSDLSRAASLAVQEGHFRADLDTEQFAFVLHSIMLGYKLDAGLFDDQSAARERADQAFRTVLSLAR